MPSLKDGWSCHDSSAFGDAVVLLQCGFQNVGEQAVFRDRHG